MALAAIVIALLLAFGGTKPKPAPKSAGGGGLLLVILIASLAMGGGQGTVGTQAAALTAPDGAAGLTPEMQAAVADLNAAMGGALDITSGYRSAADQARVCASTSLPCAPPGRSLHQQGLAIDIANWQAAAAALAAHPEIPLCRPIPASDPVHFSYVGGEC